MEGHVAEHHQIILFSRATEGHTKRERIETGAFLKVVEFRIGLASLVLARDKGWNELLCKQCLHFVRKAGVIFARNDARAVKSRYPIGKSLFPLFLPPGAGIQC